MSYRLANTVAIACIAFAAQASAQTVIVTKTLSADAASAIVVGAVEQCRKDGYRVAAAVVDRSGNLVAMLRDNGTGPHTLDSSRRKAFTSATFGITSGEFATRTANGPAAGLKDLAGVFALAGGVPIKVGNEVLGGVGVGGAPGGDKDETCATAGLQKVAEQLK